MEVAGLSIHVLYLLSAKIHIYIHPCTVELLAITSADYLAYISNYFVGLGQWKDTIIPVADNYLMAPSDLVAKGHAHNL